MSVPECDWKMALVCHDEAVNEVGQGWPGFRSRSPWRDDGGSRFENDEMSLHKDNKDTFNSCKLIHCDCVFFCHGILQVSSSWFLPH
jgi:hypothetical protein